MWPDVLIIWLIVVDNILKHKTRNHHSLPIASCERARKSLPSRETLTQWHSLWRMPHQVRPVRTWHGRTGRRRLIVCTASAVQNPFIPRTRCTQHSLGPHDSSGHLQLNNRKNPRLYGRPGGRADPLLVRDTGVWRFFFSPLYVCSGTGMYRGAFQGSREKISQNIGFVKGNGSCWTFIGVLRI